MPSSRWTFATIALLGGGAASCGDRLEAIEAPGARTPIPARVQAAFDRACAEGCHEASTQAGGLSLGHDASAAIIDGASSQSDLPLVSVGNVYGSYMAVKLLPDSALPDGVTRAGSRMPPSPTPDDLSDVALILGWISGAELPPEEEGP